jgi:hypothetical protein
VCLACQSSRELGEQQLLLCTNNTSAGLLYDTDQVIGSIGKSSFLHCFPILDGRMLVAYVAG